MNISYTIPIDTLFRDTFGIAGPAIRKYKVVKDESKEYLGAYNIQVGESDESDFTTNSLGLPVQFPMAFNGSSAYKYLDNGQVKKKFLGGCYLPFASVASFSRSKVMTETKMSGQDDAVIEMMGFNAWSITIKGFIIAGERSLIDKGTLSIEEQVKQLQQYEELADAIGVTGKIFEWLGIHKIAIISINYPDARDLDMSVIKPYEIIARSVKPIELLAA
ncbi:MAG TPA: DUF6046 domain-containing protein [Bacteroidia bacterium]|nr:DUF6046 domain-containing protein [Bacteroidia bacterium]